MTLNRDWPPDPIRPPKQPERRKPPPESAVAFGLTLGAPFVAVMLVLLLPTHPVQAWAVLPAMWLVALLIFIISSYVRQR